MKSRLPQICVLLVLFAALIIFLLQSRVERAGVAGTAARHQALPLASLDAFDAWLSANRDRGAAASRASNEEGLALAKRRAGVMLTLMKEDPRVALSRAISFSDYDRLPELLRRHVERPFSARAELLALPVCSPELRQLDPSQSVDHRLVIDGVSFSASVFGRRLAIDTKDGAPLQGVSLDGVAVVREEVFQIIDPTGAQMFPDGQSDKGRCFATGEVLGPDAVLALAGGKQFHFSSRQVLRSFDERLGALDLRPGPHTGTQVIFLMADGDDGGGFDWPAAEDEVDLQASNWTETPKDVYFIRVDFSDRAGASISQPELHNLLNSTVSDRIDEMSYGKTRINGTVSPIVVRMPNPTTTYTPTGNDALHNAAKSAAEAQISGLDLSDYDIVGVHFVGIGMGASTLSSYAGLAGGSRQWIQGNSSSNVMIHEFGHNYGVGHASFWATSDGSVVGAGVSDEYGDDFDIMGDGSNAAHFHQQAKQKLSWLESSQWIDVSSAGSDTYRVFRFDDPSTVGATRALRITKASSPAEYYWLGYRRNLPQNSWLQSGAYLIWQRPNLARSWLLDTTPGSADGRDDGAILPGRTYSDPAAGIHLTVIGTGGTAPDEWIDITVELGSFGSNSAPTATLDGPSVANAREGVTFSANAVDADGDDLAYFWDIGDGSIASNSASQTLTWTVGGTYSISVTVTDMKGGTVTKMQTVTVSDALDSWTELDSGTSSDLFDVATNGTKLVAVGSRNGTFRISTDAGESWSGGTIGINRYLRGIVWDGSQFITVGQNYDFDQDLFRGTIYTSPDGSTWTERQFGGEELRDIATSGSIDIAVGDAGTVWRSTDGIDWSPIPSGTDIDLKGVSYGDGMFVAVGSGSPGNAGGPVVVLTSADGNSWTDTSSGVGTLSWQGFYDVEFCNDRFLASGFFSKIQHSTDGGVNFLTRSTGGEQIPGFAYGNGIYLAAGIDRDNSNENINFASSDGETWGAMTSDSRHATRNSAFFFEDYFYTLGDDGEIWRSGLTAPPGGDDPFATWLGSFFPGSTPASAGLLDNDGDGLSNLQEYASGTSPISAASVRMPSLAETGGYLTLTVVKDPSVTDVSYVVEISTDMENWDTLETVVVADDAMALVVRSPTPISGAGAKHRQFMRARYTLME